MDTPLRIALGLFLVLSLPACATAGKPVTLVEDGQARCCIVVGSEDDFQEPPKANWKPKHRFLEWAAEDLATYLGKMSGATVQIVDSPVEGLVPIYVGCAPAPPGLAEATEFGDAYVIDVSEDGVVLHGESRRAVFYAAATLLDGLGVRWYAPKEIGETVPARKTVKVETGLTQHAPDFVTRRLWCRPPDELRWGYRNRLGDAVIPCGHSVHGYGANLPGWHEPGVPILESRAKHPDYYAVVDGKAGGFINLANRDVAHIFATHAIELFRQPRASGGGKQGIGSMSISPDDGFLRDERPEVVAMNSPGREPILGMPSFSDAWFAFLNRVCAEVELQAPGLEFRFGSLAYSNYILPPKKSKPDHRIIPVIAPITFNRYVSMGTPGATTSELLEQIITGWTEISPRVAVYLYNFNLADMAMPYTRRVHWTNDIPRLFELGVKDFIAESHPNWHTMVPGNYVAARLLWDVDADVDALLDEFYALYYGPAADAMRRYDTTLENAYETTDAFAGATWGMHRILTPDVMQQLDAALIEAEEQAGGHGVHEQRVEIARISLNFAKIWFAARDALNGFDLAEAEKQGAAFIANYQGGLAKYPMHFHKNQVWSPNIERYFELFHNRALRDAGRIAREGRVVHRLPDEMSAHLEPVEGGAKPSGRIPDAVRDEWRALKTFSASLDEQGLPLFRGVIWYQHTFTLPGEATGEAPLVLWFGGLDSRVQVWLNGQDLGKDRARTMGPVEFDITQAVRRDGANDLIIAVDNTFPNELGTGGIVRPAVVYMPRP